ncbi:hypothetical protein MC885_019334 [Smutsia gigantea]|nr:hypothetical protein MC885_019334 [Smutsia gigantea]
MTLVAQGDSVLALLCGKSPFCAMFPEKLDLKVEQLVYPSFTTALLYNYALGTAIKVVLHDVTDDISARKERHLSDWALGCASVPRQGLGTVSREVLEYRLMGSADATQGRESVLCVQRRLPTRKSLRRGSPRARDQRIAGRRNPRVRRLRGFETRFEKSTDRKMRASDSTGAGGHQAIFSRERSAASPSRAQLACALPQSRGDGARAENAAPAPPAA